MKRSLDQELMDIPGQPPEILRGELRNLTLLNRYLGNHAAVIGAFNRLIDRGAVKGFSLLDVGTASADIPLRVMRWARERKLDVRIAALDNEEITVREAKKWTRGVAEISVLRGDGAAPPFRRASFDYVLASQLLHHFSEDKIVSLLRGWAQIARRAIIVSDLVRNPLAYHGIRLVTRLLTRNIMTRTDGPLSVQRAFTLAEWREIFRRADVGAFQVRSMFPFRMRAIVNLR